MMMICHRYRVSWTCGGESRRAAGEEPDGRNSISSTNELGCGDESNNTKIQFPRSLGGWNDDQTHLRCRIQYKKDVMA